MGTKVYDNYADLITFNRNSKGTALRPIGYGDELVTNGTFDTDTSGWVLSQYNPSSSQSVVSGKLRLTIGGGESNARSSQAITTVIGTTYAYSVDAFQETSSVDPQFKVGTNAGSSNIVSINCGSSDGTFTGTFTATTTTTYITVQNNGGGDGAYADFDNVSVKEVLFDREDDPLTLFLHPEGVPRIEYDADSNLKGLLIEPDGENICLQSEDFTTTWSTVNATLTANATTAPDGTTTADKLGDDSGGGTSAVRLLQTITVSGNTKYTASVFLKADQLSFARLRVEDIDGGTDGNQFFDLSGAGSLGTASNLDDSSITAYPNGWYRCSITWTQGASDTSFEFRIFPADSISSITVDLDGTSSIFVWGAQVEASPIATSYMPTAGSTFTRGKDEASMTNVSGLIGQKEGTLYVEVDWRASGTVQILLSVNDGTGNNNMLIFRHPGGQLLMRAVANNTIQNNQGQSASGYSGIQKIAFAYADGDFELYRNGSSISTLQDPTKSLAALATLTDIDLGQSNTAVEQANMHIRNVQIIPRRLSDAQLIELTS